MAYRGEVGAQAALQQGDIWGNALQNIGNTVAGAITQHQEQKQQKARDKAWSDFVESGEWQKDPAGAYAFARKTFGPEGDKHFASLAAVGEMTQRMQGGKLSPEQAQKGLGIVGQSLKGMDDATWQRHWPQLRQYAATAFPGSPIPEQYDPASRPQMEALIGQLQPKDAYTLGKNEKRVENGKVVAENIVPEEPKLYPVTVPGPNGPVQKLATQAEMQAGVQAYREPKAPRDEPLVAVMGTDGEPVLVPRSQASGKRPASTREQGRPVISGDANRIADLDTSMDDLATLRGEIGGTGATGVRAKIGAALPDVVTEMTGLGAEAKSKQATIDRVKQVVGKALEEGVLRKEDEAKYAKILPTISDPPQVVQAKLDGLEKAIKLKRERLIGSLGEAGFDVDRYSARQGGRPGPRASGGLSSQDDALLKKYGY